MERPRIEDLSSHLRDMNLKDISDSLKFSERVKKAGVGVALYGLANVSFGIYGLVEYGEVENVHDYWLGLIVGGATFTVTGSAVYVLNRRQGENIIREANRRGLTVQEGFIRNIKIPQLESGQVLQGPDSNHHT